MALTYPLDQIRTLAQAQDFPDKSNLYQKLLFLIQNDPKSLYRGCVSVIETIAISNFIYFYILQFSKRFFGKNTKNSALLSSTFAAVLNTVITEPLWKASTVIKMTNSNDSLFQVVYKLASRDGILSLWSGTRVSLYLVSNPIIQFTIYESLKNRANGGGEISSSRAFFIGAVSKSIATVTTYPLQVAQTRLRIPSNSRKSMLEILSELFATQGIEGLFRGCSAKLYQTVLTAAFLFAFYERLVRIIAKK